MLKQLREKKQGSKSKGQSMMEYVVLMLFILGALAYFHKYVARGLAGRWKGVGDSFGSGRVYDHEKTKECGYDYRFTNKWYDQACFERDCQTTCFSFHINQQKCIDCIEACVLEGGTVC